jgi:hypothetical protein
MSKVMSILGALAARITATKSAVAELRQETSGLEAEDAAAVAEAGALHANDAPDADLEKGAREFGLAQRAKLKAGHGTAWRRLAGRFGPTASSPFAPVLVGPELPDFLVGAPVTWEALAGVFPDLFAQFVVEVAATPDFQAGPPLAARPARLAAIQARREQIAAKHTAICDEAAELGVQIPLLPAVAARRSQAAQSLARAQEALLHFERANQRPLQHGDEGVWAEHARLTARVAELEAEAKAAS